MARSLQSAKSSALGAITCVNLLKVRVGSLRDDNVVAEMVEKVKVCATQNGLKMPDAEPRVSRTPARYRQAVSPEALSQATGERKWRSL